MMAAAEPRIESKVSDTTTKTMDTGTCDVSVIIPYRNGADSVAECLAGLIQQETQRSVEVIVVDDGSAASDSAAVLADLLEQRNAAHWITRNDAGVSGEEAISLPSRDLPEECGSGCHRWIAAGR